MEFSLKMKVYHMGYYKVTYTDGTETKLEVKYGTNIASSAIFCSLGDNKEGFNPTSLDESALGEVSYSTIPFRKNGKTWYKTAFLNPYPGENLGLWNICPTGRKRWKFYR